MSNYYQWVSIRPEETVLKSRLLDTLFWSSQLSRNSSLQAIFKRRADKVIGADIFEALYNYNPELKQEPPDPAMSAWIRQTLADPAFQALRAKTMGDQSLAAAGTIRLYQELMRPQESELKAVAEVKHRLDQMETLYEGMPGVDKAIEGMKQAQQDIAGSIDASPTKMPGIEMNQYGKFDTAQVDQRQQQMKKAAETASESLLDAEELAEFESGGSGLDDGSGEKVLHNILDKKLIESVGANDKLRQVLRVMGRMRIVLEAERSRKPKPAPPPMELTFGDNLQDIVPSELAYLAEPDLEDLFWHKYSNKGLLMYERKDRVREGKGPFVCCLDVSGSMSGEPERYALALFASLARQAIKQHRQVALIVFASIASKPMVISSADELVKVITTGKWKVGSGTEFHAPLSEAATFIKESKQWKQADVLFVTDGLAYLGKPWIEQFKELKKKLEFRLVGVGVWREFTKDLTPLFDATTYMARDGSVRSLQWLSKAAVSMV